MPRIGAPVFDEHGRRRAMILEKLRRGVLSTALPSPKLRMLPRKRWGPAAAACAGCDEPITIGEVFVIYRDRSWRVVPFHEACDVIWSGARRHLRRRHQQAMRD